MHAGAISKANANDPKKSGLVRCARTDKGVHAAGNIVSLKLILEDSNIVETINSHLSPQIRVWGIERTVGSFSCYQACDSRWYEYLIPSHAFLPPNPRSFLGKKMVDFAQEAGDLEALKQRQQEVSGFWDEADEMHIKPIVDALESPLKELVVKALFEPEDDTEASAQDGELSEKQVLEEVVSALPTAVEENGEDTSTTSKTSTIRTEAHATPSDAAAGEVKASPGPSNSVDPEPAPALLASSGKHAETSLRKQVESTTKRLRAAYLLAKRQYRIPAARQTRIREALEAFIGTHNFHNYTVNKAPRDPSARRLIKSFTLDPEPKIINGTEWLSIKIHGQSFMMHQIRKMISAVALVVRCGCPIARIAETLSADVGISVPKVPGLGLLLERPVFKSYNENTAAKYDREKLDFAKYEAEMEKFKQTEIYERIFREEEEQQQFHTFFGHVVRPVSPALHG